MRRHLLLPSVESRRFLFISLLIVFSVPGSSQFAGSLSSRAITLRSIQFYNPHEFLAPHPTIYFHCIGENKTILPDVKEKHFSYIFKGEESWQPLTELPGNKCKRCGLYEFDRLKSDDVFDEWELCPGDFINGIAVHYKAEEFNATLVCQECRAAIDPAQTPGSSGDGSAHSKINVDLIVAVSVFVSVVATLAAVTVYKYWQKRKRERNQARFLKLFEDGDDIEDELGLGI